MANYFLPYSVSLLILLLSTCNGYQVDNNPYRHMEILDKDGKFQLEWLVDLSTSRIIFNATVQTKGYIGLGLSRKGKMSGADIVIGGVLPNGQPYFSDRHAIANQLPVEDPSQDWTLHEAWERGSVTFLSFSRPFETCDEDYDIPIHDDVLYVLWAFGEKDDDIEYHHQNRGSFLAYLLSPDLTPRELQKTENHGIRDNSLGNWKVWSIEQNQVIPAQDTTYFCTIYKSPVKRKQHIVGFRSIFPTEVERRHIHHYVFYHCIPPGGRQEDAPKVFDHLVGRSEECYVFDEPTGQIPTHFCTKFVHVWAVGQKPVFYPDHVGIPLNPNEYYMLQVHYDNPQILPSIRVNHALETFYTDKLRKHDAGALAVSELSSTPSIMIPPNSLAHHTYAHCAPECTQRIIPPSGIHVFAGYLHTHLAGRAIRLQHFRNGKELPWLNYDNNFNFNYQQIRIFREERQILPGDTLINRCTYENADSEGNVTIGGFSTREEMCVAILWHYDQIPDRVVCSSDIRSDEYREFLQIRNYTWSNPLRENIVTSPPSNAGLKVSEVSNYRMDWSLENRKRIQEYHRNLPQVSSCRSNVPSEEEADNDNRRRSSGGRLQRLTLERNPYSPQKTSNGLSRQNLATHSRRSSLTTSTATEIQDPDSEFISYFPKHIMPYERPSICSSFKLK